MLRLEESYKLLFDYQYINHPNKTISFLEQDYPTPSRDPAFDHLKEVATILAFTIQGGVAKVVEMVDETHHLAELALLLVKEAVEWFRRLANDSSRLLEVEYSMLNKRISVIRRRNTSRGKERETDFLPGERRQFLLQTLEIE